ncbi:hypothetical protein GMRT_12261 [Giardia muris]|uniref:Uncharacterized protein n=1 Tax=Giardia muris TaxID=5742 RepID=A0A4Z1T8X3_GIAMU|nr:hypothetical protein GMRT_12261 [Giardia muris]|eukprot:TNJ30583.1 hypothetical protein GMRT_12261 [Giardia muris]
MHSSLPPEYCYATHAGKCPRCAGGVYTGCRCMLQRRALIQGDLEKTRAELEEATRDYNDYHTRYLCLRADELRAERGLPPRTGTIPSRQVRSMTCAQHRRKEDTSSDKQYTDPCGVTHVTFQKGIPAPAGNATNEDLDYFTRQQKKIINRLDQDTQRARASWNADEECMNRLLRLAEKDAKDLRTSSQRILQSSLDLQHDRDSDRTRVAKNTYMLQCRERPFLVNKDTDDYSSVPVKMRQVEYRRAAHALCSEVKDTTYQPTALLPM